MLDEDGYLFLTGRLKEQINRGGEKISPLEVDDVLLGHPAVAEAVTFGHSPRQARGRVGAAVVLADAEVTEEELRAHVARHLAAFKVPARILFLEEIPKGATGKIQRIGLAATPRPLTTVHPRPR
jgi:acyl-CoA synthetase (AMP-forming)/AMP-acid ligase II